MKTANVSSETGVICRRLKAAPFRGKTKGLPPHRGAGGIGLIFAEEIASRVKNAVLVLTEGRKRLMKTAPPAYGAWKRRVPAYCINR